MSIDKLLVQNVRTREKLIESGIFLFSREGYKSTSTREVEKHAGVKRSLISYHFKNKEEFWKICITALFSCFTKQFLNRNASSAVTDSQERLSVMVSRFMQTSSAIPEVGQILADESRKNSWRLQWIVQNHYKDFFWTIEQIYLQGRRRNQFSKVSLNQFYYLLISSINVYSQSVAHQMITGENPHQENSVRAFSSLLINCLESAR